MKIHIFGASGSGVTTLGEELSRQTYMKYFDCDDYFWETTELSYTKKRLPEIRNRMLNDDLGKSDNWVLGGSLIQWGYDFHSTFDLAVFLWIPPEIRIERVKIREYNRFGEKNFNDPLRSKQYQEFIEWVSGYDNNSSTGRNLELHELFLKKVQCDTLEIRGDYTTEQRIDMIINKINRNCMSVRQS